MTSSLFPLLWEVHLFHGSTSHAAWFLLIDTELQWEAEVQERQLGPGNGSGLPSSVLRIDDPLNYWDRKGVVWPDIFCGP